MRQDFLESKWSDKICRSSHIRRIWLIPCVVDKEERDGEYAKKNIKVIWWIKSLLASYIVTGISLLVLTFFMYKFELNEKNCIGGNCWNLCSVNTDRRNDHRETDKIKTVLVGGWFLESYILYCFCSLHLEFTEL